MRGIVTPEELHQIAELIGGLSNEIQDMRREFHSDLQGVKVRLDLIEARLDKQGGQLQSGSRWVNRLTQWAEKTDRFMMRQDEAPRDHGSRIDKLEHPSA